MAEFDKAQKIATNRTLKASAMADYLSSMGAKADDIALMEEQSTTPEDFWKEVAHNAKQRKPSKETVEMVIRFMGINEREQADPFAGLPTYSPTPVEGVKFAGCDDAVERLLQERYS